MSFAKIVIGISSGLMLVLLVIVDVLILDQSYNNQAHKLDQFLCDVIGIYRDGYGTIDDINLDVISFNKLYDYRPFPSDEVIMDYVLLELDELIEIEGF